MIDSTEPATEFVGPPRRTELNWIALDFDGTVCVSTWSPDNPAAFPGQPIQEHLDRLYKLLEREPHLKVVIHTSRPWTDYELIESYLNHHNIPFEHIVCGKLLAKYYIDDRAVSTYDPDWCKDERYAN